MPKYNEDPHEQIQQSWVNLFWVVIAIACLLLGALCAAEPFAAELNSDLVVYCINDWQGYAVCVDVNQVVYLCDWVDKAPTLCQVID